MSDVKYTTEMTQRVFDNDFGFAVVIEEDHGGCNLISIYYSEDGKRADTDNRITIDARMALLVAAAIVKQANYIIKREGI